MSLILDALKKLEKDKIIRRKKPVHIASDILLTGETAARRRTIVLIAGLAGIAVAALVVTIVIVNSSPVRTPVTELVTGPTVADQRAASIPEVEASASRMRTPTAAVHGAGTDETISGSAVKSKQKAAAPKSRERAEASEEVQLPILTVSGIAWMEDSRARRAMVNGEIVSEGGRVGRTKVLKIHPDHVLFSHQGRNFSVYMK